MSPTMMVRSKFKTVLLLASGAAAGMIAAAALLAIWNIAPSTGEANRTDAPQASSAHSRDAVGPSRGLDEAYRLDGKDAMDIELVVESIATKQFVDIGVLANNGCEVNVRIKNQFRNECAFYPHSLLASAQRSEMCVYLYDTADEEAPQIWYVQGALDTGHGDVQEYVILKPGEECRYRLWFATSLRPAIELPDAFPWKWKGNAYPENRGHVLWAWDLEVFAVQEGKIDTGASYSAKGLVNQPCDVIVE